jgi:predicted nucleic acid-binding protein
MTTSPPIRVVLDTNVLVAAARSRQGASFAIVSAIPSPAFIPCLSVSLYAQWQDVLTRSENLPPGRTAADAMAFLRYLASQSHLQQVHFLWRPHLADADDDMVLELAFAAGCRHIITHNTRDFRGAAELGIDAITPARFLTWLRKPS